MKLFKPFTASLLALTLSASMGMISTGAASNFTDCKDNGVDEIKIGTPKIDAELDSAYTKSLILGDLGRAPNSCGSVWPGTAEADIYLLHDDNYLYICAVVEDDDVLSRGEKFVTESENPINNDCIEFRVSLDGTADTVKFSIDAYGYRCFGLPDHYDIVDYDSVIYETQITSDGYIVELAIPYSGDNYDLSNESELGFTYQLNDIDEYGNYFFHSTSFNGEDEKEPVFYDLSNERAISFTDCEDNGVDEIMIGTPKIDAELDSAYTKSLILGDLGRAPNAYGTIWPGTAEADIYFLHDNDYLYICAVVEDDDVLTKGKVYATGQNPYSNDCIEFRLSLDGTKETVKVSIDAYGYNCFGLSEDYSIIDYDNIIYETQITAEGYIVEVAIPYSGDRYDLSNESTLGFTYQLNDIDKYGNHFNHTTSFNGEAEKEPVFYELSDECAISFTDCEDNGINTIMFGTPLVDAELDSAYTKSLILGDLGRAPNSCGSVWPGTAEADIYLLHDDDYLYICAVVEDDDVLSRGEKFVTESENPINNDCIEFRVSLDGTADTVKFSIDAYGYRCFGLPDHYDIVDYDSVIYETQITSDGYIVELAIPYSGDNYDLSNESELGFTYQLNDIDEYGNYFFHSTSFNGEDEKEPVFYDLYYDNEETAVIKISSANAVSGGTVKVNVVLENNPGIASMRLGIGYDSDVFTLISVEDCGLLGSCQHSDNFTDSPYTLCWSNGTITENITSNGVIATLTFLVADDAPEGEYDFTASFARNDVLDVNINAVRSIAYNGTVNILPGTLGDASGDGVADMADLMYFNRYLASWKGYNEETVNTALLDLNLDGSVNPLDSVILARHLAKWIGYETLPYNPA